MRLDFFTLGGRFFWEDVFFYQKWRIQRHANTKKCRLLDNWDICRFEGTFNDCYKAFLKNIEIYEIARQNGHMIIMLPGLAEGKNIFKPLWREVIKKNYLVAAINYPSTLKNSDSHAKQIDFLLNHMEDVSKISFITKGAGILVLDQIMKSKSVWRKKMQIAKIIAINPPVKTPAGLKLLAKTNFGKWLLGPMLNEIINYKQSPQLKEIINTTKLNKNAIAQIIKKL